MKPQRSVLGNQVPARGIGAIMGVIVLFAGGVSFTAPATAQSLWPPPGSCAIEGGLHRFAWLAMEAADANGNGAVTAVEARALFPGLDATQLIFSFTQVYPLDDGYVFWSEISQLLYGIEGLFDFIRDNIFTFD